MQQRLLTITEFIGHFHPALVHLPIGILVVGLLLHWLSEKENYRAVRPAVSWIYGLGFISALLSSVSGYLLSLGDDYDPFTVTLHMWLAFVTTLVSGFMYYQTRKERFDNTSLWTSILLAVVLVLTGHLGGSLTHGSDFISFSVLSAEDGSGFKRKPVPNVQEAMIYTDLVEPLLHEKCYRCHGKNKRKGGLRMDDMEALLKGGKDGVVLIPSDAEHSEIWKRLVLPAEDDDHMPPKEKPQLQEHETALLKWWIQNGAPVDTKVAELSQDQKQVSMLARFEEDDHTPLYNTDIPQEPVARADQLIIDSLEGMGIVVLPVSQQSNYLELSVPYNHELPAAFAELLPQLGNQLVSLKAGFSKIRNADLRLLATCKKLIRLELQYSQVTDSAMTFVRNLDSLKYLNLVGTAVSYSGITQLKDVPSLQQIYLYQTRVSGADWQKLQTELIHTRIDTGGYRVATLAADTTVFKREVYQ